MINIRVMSIEDYDKVYDLWINTPGMGLNLTDDSRDGIDKYLKRNPTSSFVAKDGEKVVGVILSGHDGREIGNQFWENIGFTVRDDLVYRNKNIHELKRINT